MANAPYTAGRWKKILACGRSVEASLERSGVLLTMGGEPTFVPSSPDGAEWLTDALGPTKLGYARRLGHELVRTAFPGAVLLETSGKLYPSEPLPRWALLIQWLADGSPIWRDLRRLRADGQSGANAPGTCGTFIVSLARALALDPARVLPLAEAHEPNETLGFVLPLDHDGAKWITDDWAPYLGTGPVVLVDGDSVAGLRLPLGELGDDSVRRALTAEVRDGALTIFVPPLLLADYVALLSAIESTLERLDLGDVVLAGYAPPPDPALPTVGLASDPGVLEVNLSPCATWAEYDA
ncbi:MAG: transglutaminase family protein, partial [Longimicrobiales bacterium]